MMRRMGVAFLSVLLIASSAWAGSEKVGLLVIAHGAPMEAWNAPVRAVGEEVAALVADCDAIAGSKLAFLEFAKPSIPEVVRAFEEEGYTRLIAVPLFIAPSGHSILDIPAMLGLYTDPDIRETLEEEGAEIVDTELRITVTQAMALGDVLAEIMVDRVRALSQEPEKEAVVLLAHGSRMTKPVWKRIGRDIGSAICGRTGITYYDYGLVEVGQSFMENGYPALYRAGEERETVLCVGLYISMGVEKMIARHKDKKGMDGKPLFEGLDIRAAKHGLLPDPRVAKWVVRTAEQALEQ